jgi:hypothetical protein
METGTIILIAILVIAIIVMIIVTYVYQTSNTSANVNNILYPFSATIQPGNTSVYLNNSLGTSQIDCSKYGPNAKINIVAAWSETVDPYGTCSTSNISALNLSCGLVDPHQKVSCKTDSDCGPGMTCIGGICKPSTCPLTTAGSTNGIFDSSKCNCSGTYCFIQPGTVCTTNTDCKDANATLMHCKNPTGGAGKGVCTVNDGQSCFAPDPFTGEFCAVYPLCSNAVKNITAGVTNTICNAKNTDTQSICRPRDASAYLAAKCDGKNTCLLQYDPENINAGFGTRPCDFRITDSKYNDLPNTPGSGGNFSRGMLVHGLYSCIV